jgi:diguanylate cyclase (GGDEF)-like protein
MVVEEDVVGVLYLGRAKGRPAFEAREEGLAEMAAGQLGMSITARFLYEQMTEKRKQVELIDKISKAVSAPASLGKVLALVVETGRQALRAEGAALVLADEEGKFRVRCADGLDGASLDPAADGVSARLIRGAIEKGRPRVHASSEPKQGPSSALAVPVKLSLRDKRVFNERRRVSRRAPASKVLGVLYVEGRAGIEEFTEDDQFVLQVFADHITTALTKDSLYQQASTDGLTGLASRRYLDQRLADEMAFATRNGTPLSVILIDLDDFKRLNDTHGHQAGDEVLREIGTILRESVRRFDVSGRYGGEEFILALPETETEGALVVAENVREKVKKHRFVDPKAPLPVTVTLGIATFPTHAADLHSLIGAADMALYEGKRAGKDRYQVAKS